MHKNEKVKNSMPPSVEIISKKKNEKVKINKNAKNNKM